MQYSTVDCMANRLTKIYTRTGDSGETGTADGSRVAKDSLQMQLQGDLDEVNSILGLLAGKLQGDNRELILDIQHSLFDIGGEISLNTFSLDAHCVLNLESLIDNFNTQLQPLKEFILPGGNEAGSLCHLARVVCRRAERNMVAFNRQRTVNPSSLAYINRLSDLLFVFARVLNDKQEIYWQSDRLQRDGKN